jgi:hypothetical protein
MAALTPYRPIQSVLRDMDSATYASVGWSLMWQIGRGELRRERSVVLDGMAGPDEVAATRALGAECHARCVVFLTKCDDTALQRARVEARSRAIPGWHELTWDHVKRARQAWRPPGDVDLVIDTTRPVEDAISTALRGLGV